MRNTCGIHAEDVQNIRKMSINFFLVFPCNAVHYFFLTTCKFVCLGLGFRVHGSRFSVQGLGSWQVPKNIDTLSPSARTHARARAHTHTHTHTHTHRRRGEDLKFSDLPKNRGGYRVLKTPQNGNFRVWESGGSRFQNVW